MFGSGQIGHIKVANNGIICGCGREGCLETEASSTALCKQYLSRQENASKLVHIDDFVFDDFVKLYQNDDPIAQEVAMHAATILGQSLYNFLITLNINKSSCMEHLCSR